MIISKSISEERKEKLSRYRNKKTKRNFGRKIKVIKLLNYNESRVFRHFALKLFSVFVLAVCLQEGSCR